MALLSKFRIQTFGSRMTWFNRYKGRDYRKAGGNKRVKVMNTPKKSLRQDQTENVGARGEKVFALKFFMPDSLRGLGFLLGIIPAFALFTINWSNYHSKSYRRGVEIASGVLSTVFTVMVSTTLGLKSLGYGFNIWKGISVEDRVRQALSSGLGTPTRVVTILYLLFFSHMFTAKEYCLGPILAIMASCYSSWHTAQITVDGGFPRWFHSLKTNWMMGQNAVLLLLISTLYCQRSFDRKMEEMRQNYQSENLEDKMLREMDVVPKPKY